MGAVEPRATSVTSLGLRSRFNDGVFVDDKALVEAVGAGREEAFLFCARRRRREYIELDAIVIEFLA